MNRYYRRARRFGNNTYRLLRTLPHVDSRGKLRSPEATKLRAEQQADFYRNKGFNARVVNWVGGSGIYIGRKNPRTYYKTKAEAREQWMKEIELTDYNAAAFGVGMSFSNSAQAGDSVATATSALPADAVTDQEFRFIGHQYKHENSMSMLEDVLEEINVTPIHIAEPRDANYANGFGRSLRMADSIKEVGDYGQIGWGPGEIPKKRMPQKINNQRSRFRVVLSFNQDANGEVGVGERPTYAFATKEAAMKFSTQLRQMIDENGYYLEGGNLESRGMTVSSPKYAIPANQIEVEIVKEESGFAQRAADEARASIERNVEVLFPLGNEPPNLMENRMIFRLSESDVDVQKMEQAAKDQLNRMMKKRTAKVPITDFRKWMKGEDNLSRQNSLPSASPQPKIWPITGADVLYIEDKLREINGFNENISLEDNIKNMVGMQAYQELTDFNQRARENRRDL